MLGLLATFTIFHLAFHFVVDADHLACRLGTPRTAGQYSIILIRCDRLIDMCPFPAEIDTRTVDTLPSSNTDWACQLSAGTFSRTVPLSTITARPARLNIKSPLNLEKKKI